MKGSKIYFKVRNEAEFNAIKRAYPDVYKSTDYDMLKSTTGEMFVRIEEDGKQYGWNDSDIYKGSYTLTPCPPTFIKYYEQIQQRSV